MKAAFEWIGLCLFIALLYATCGGVTANGRHYQVQCGPGVEFINEPVRKP